jgi:hypothetical protein
LGNEDTMSSHDQQQTQAWPSASKKRRLLAVYVDFLLFSAAVALVCWALGRLDPSLAVAPLWVQITTFLVVEAIVVKAVAWSPGHWSLGIYRAAVPGLGPTPVVSPNIVNAERWWTVLLGVLIALEGTKMAVRWSMWHPPVPLMGAQLEFAPSAVFSVVMGGMLCAVGLFVLRCRPKAASVGMALYAIALISGALSYELWSSWAAADVVARREYRGLPVREGEIETMRRWAPMLAVGAPALMLAWLVAAGRRFSRAA